MVGRGRDAGTWPSSSPSTGSSPGSRCRRRLPGRRASVRTAQIDGYFRVLAKGSPRVRVEAIGRSDEGREILLAIVSDEKALADLPG